MRARYEKGTTRRHIEPHTPLPADAVPILTRGGLLVDRLVQATIASVEKPRNRGLLQAMSERRLALEAYVKESEKAAGVYRSATNNQGGQPSSKGWSVCKTRHGSWRLTLTSLMDGRPHQIGTFKTRAKANEEGLRRVTELRTAPNKGSSTSNGYTVWQLESGRYIAQIMLAGPMRGRSAGTRNTRAEAEQLGYDTVAKLRGEAA